VNEQSRALLIRPRKWSKSLFASTKRLSISNI
jgi:hypothetical protein